MNNTDFLNTNYYYSNCGVTVEVIPASQTKYRNKWRFRFPPSNVWHCGFDSKFKALLLAANICGRSGKDMNFKPINN